MACRASGLTDQSLTRLHDHATSVVLLADEGIVVRVSPLSQRPRLDTAVALTRWLVANGFPATEPADLPQPLIYAPHAVTFWRHYPQPEGSGPPAGPLGALLRELHSLPTPPIPLARFQTLTSFKSSVESSCYLPSAQREWLAARREELLDRYGKLDFPLGQGHIHGDAYPGNTLWSSDGVRLGDWDEAAFGPREIDLANTFQGVRFGRTVTDLETMIASDRYRLMFSRTSGPCRAAAAICSAVATRPRSPVRRSRCSASSRSICSDASRDRRAASAARRGRKPRCACISARTPEASRRSSSSSVMRVACRGSPVARYRCCTLRSSWLPRMTPRPNSNASRAIPSTSACSEQAAASSASPANSAARRSWTSRVSCRSISVRRAMMPSWYATVASGHFFRAAATSPQSTLASNCTGARADGTAPPCAACPAPLRAVRRHHVRRR
ncbi:aminoglycoside phosphotransferase family protein [Streptomyces sp. NBC_00631]|uniref:aminoglycoside phosphotransferase family protein n=1 Tax=Streptomyces sp. NBC_00631 TaxID=2975793 RepID=UPI0030E5AFBE